MEMFDEFAQFNDAEVQFKAFGLAGQAIVLHRRQQDGESAEKLVQLWPLRNKLEGEMRYLIETMLSRTGPGRTTSARCVVGRNGFANRPPPNPREPAPPRPRPSDREVTALRCARASGRIVGRSGICLTSPCRDVNLA